MIRFILILSLLFPANSLAETWTQTGTWSNATPYQCATTTPVLISGDWNSEPHNLIYQDNNYQWDLGGNYGKTYIKCEQINAQTVEAYNTADPAPDGETSWGYLGAYNVSSPGSVSCSSSQWSISGDWNSEPVFLNVNRVLSVDTNGNSGMVAKKCVQESATVMTFWASSDYQQPPPEPSTCTNGVRDWDDVNEVWLEDGVDCGGSCASPDDTCTQYCPAGFHIENRPPLNVDVCYSDDTTEDYTVDSKLGVCPSGYYVSNTDPDKCVTAELVTNGAADLLTPEANPADTTPWNNVFTQENTVIENTTNTVDGVTTQIDTTTVTGSGDSGEAVEEVTTVTTVTQADGSKVETTVVDTTVRAPSGAVTGGTITTTDTYAPTGELTGQTITTEQIESEEGAGAAFTAPGDGAGYVVDGEKGGQFATRFDEFQTAVDAAPIMQPIAGLFAGPDTSTKTPLYSLGMGSYGTKSFDLSTYDSVFSAIGALFIFLSTLAAARMIMVKGA